MNNNLKISISKGNIKLGGIANFNLPPLKTCTPDACKTCGITGCYALKSYRQYPNVKTAWNNNLFMVINHLNEVENQLDIFLSKYKKSVFRIHSSGDFFINDRLDLDYFLVWYRLAKKYPKIQFLAYTKSFNTLIKFTKWATGSYNDNGFKYIPNNLVIRLSDWEGLYIPLHLKKWFKIATVINTVDELHNKEWLCMGDCRKCNECYYNNNDVAFLKH